MTESVRRGGPGDLRATAALAADVLPAAADAKSLRRFLEAPGGCLWVVPVVPEGEGLAGFLLAQLAADELEILWMGVAASRRREAIGRRLVEAALREEAVRVVHLEVRAGNRGARAFYRALGFEEAGVRGEYYGDGEDAVRMVRGEGG